MLSPFLYRQQPGVEVEKMISPFVNFLCFSIYLLHIMFMFGRHHHSLAVVTPFKDERDSAGHLEKHKCP